MQSTNFSAYPRRAQPTSGSDGIDAVRCLICGKHLCVISGRHLSTHGTDRETYMEEYRLTPDQLCSKTFRINHSSRPDYRPHNRREWMAAMKAVYKKHGNVYAGFLQKTLSKPLCRRDVAKRWGLGCSSPCTGIHTRTYAATKVLGDRKSCH